MKHKNYCKWDECSNRSTKRGYCDRHYKQYVTDYGIEPERLHRKWTNTECLYDGCTNKPYQRGYCRKHYDYLMNSGQIEPVYTKPTMKKRTIDSNGYVFIRINGRVVREHRFIMSKAIGRELLDEENVHHKNGNRQDNRLENLELWSTTQPCGQRVEDKIEYALYILNLYRPELLLKEDYDELDTDSTVM